MKGFWKRITPKSNIVELSLQNLITSLLFVFHKPFSEGIGCDCFTRGVESSFWFELIMRETVREKSFPYDVLALSPVNRYYSPALEIVTHIVELFLILVLLLWFQTHPNGITGIS